jgi:hypothetical protein
LAVTLISTADAKIIGAVEANPREKASAYYQFEKYSGRRIAPLPNILKVNCEGAVLILGENPNSPMPTMADLMHPIRMANPAIFAVDRQTFDEYVAKIESTNEHGLPKRPASRKVIAEGAPVPIAPPKTWTALPAVAARTETAPSEPLEKLPWPDGFGDRVFSYFRSRQIERTPPVPHLTTADWERFDRATGKRIGEPIPLAPWIVSPDKIFSHYGQTRSDYSFLTVSQSPLGNKIAYSDPATPGRIDLFAAEGNWIGGFFPNGKKSAVEWVKFVDEDRFLTQTDVLLSSFTVADGKLTRDFALDGDYIGPHEFTADAKIVAIGSSASLDFIDTKSGQVLNRLPCPHDGLVTDMAFSPDGKRLAALFVSDPRPRSP